MLQHIVFIHVVIVYYFEICCYAIVMLSENINDAEGNKILMIHSSFPLLFIKMLIISGIRLRYGSHHYTRPLSLVSEHIVLEQP